MEIELPLWFPNYKNNPGIVSKELKIEISTLLEHFQATVVEGYFEGYEKFNLKLEIQNEQYLDYIKNTLYQKYGKFVKAADLEVGDVLLGRLQKPGKVGFGIFTDIGIRENGKQNDGLIPLYQLREDFELGEISTRDIVKQFGLIDGYPVVVEITSIEREGKLKIDLALADSSIDLFLDWAETNSQRLLMTKVLKSSVTQQIKKLQLDKYIDSVEQQDPLTMVVLCKSRTNASGILPKIGARLNKVPIGIFHPEPLQ